MSITDLDPDTYAQLVAAAHRAIWGGDGNWSPEAVRAVEAMTSVLEGMGDH